MEQEALLITDPSALTNVIDYITITSVGNAFDFELI